MSKKYEGYLIATDFDGTLAGPGAVISRENSLAIRHFQENGGMFTIASGRIPSFLSKYSDSFVANAPLICTNGTVICAADEPRILHYMPFQDDVEDFVRYLFSLDKVERMLLSGIDEDRLWQEIHQPGVSVESYFEIPKPWCRILVHQSPEDTLYLKEDLSLRFSDRYCFARSYPMGLEITVKGSGKGPCLRWIRQYLGDQIHTTIGVGDYENDISLIRDADIGYAVENAIDECKAVADRITVSNKEHAIARIIDELG